MTADTIVPDPSNPQTLNRYSYCGNNPLIYVDPSGPFNFLSAFVGAIFGGIQAAISGENVIKGAVSGAISGLLFYGAGEGWFFGNTIAQHSVAGALSGGANAALNGGNIGKGMLSGGLSGGLSEYTGIDLPKDAFSQFLGRTAVGGITGGITSEMNGGSFSDGFLSEAHTAGYGYLFNHGMHEFEEKFYSSVEQRNRADAQYQYQKQCEEKGYFKPPKPTWPNIYHQYHYLTGAEGGAYILLGTAAFATGWFAPEVYALGVNYVLTNPQGALDYTTSILPGSAHANSKEGGIGAGINWLIGW